MWENPQQPLRLMVPNYETRRLHMPLIMKHIFVLILSHISTCESCDVSIYLFIFEIVKRSFGIIVLFKGGHSSSPLLVSSLSCAFSKMIVSASLTSSSFLFFPFFPFFCFFSFFFLFSFFLHLRHAYLNYLGKNEIQKSFLLPDLYIGIKIS